MRDQEVTHAALGTTPRPDAADALADGRADGRADLRPDGGRRAGADPLLQVRATDVEPYTGLGYLSKLFRIIAVLLVVLMIVEAVTGFYTTGRDALPTLLSESSRLIVLAGLLWGVGDLANLLIDVGHDVRATRILIGRQTAMLGADHIVEPTGRPAREPRGRGARAELLPRPELDDRAG